VLRASGDMIVEAGQSSNVIRVCEPRDEQLFQDCGL
jgi:hypothetical protein